MKTERKHSLPACRVIRELETYLASPVVCVVVFNEPGEFAFVFPAESDDDYVSAVLECIASACQDASKSL